MLPCCLHMTYWSHTNLLSTLDHDGPHVRDFTFISKHQINAKISFHFDCRLNCVFLWPIVEIYHVWSITLYLSALMKEIRIHEFGIQFKNCLNVTKFIMIGKTIQYTCIQFITSPKHTRRMWN